MIGTGTPIFRSFDETKEREFYLDYLGFEITFEHRFDETAPLYLGIRLGDFQLHLSEHHGDASPGGAVRIESFDLKAFHEELSAKSYRYARPGSPQQQSWGSLELILTDPFHNRLVFFQDR